MLPVQHPEQVQVTFIIIGNLEEEKEQEIITKI